MDILDFAKTCKVFFAAAELMDYEYTQTIRILFDIKCSEEHKNSDKAILLFNHGVRSKRITEHVLEILDKFQNVEEVLMGDYPDEPRRIAIMFMMVYNNEVTQ